MTDTSAVSSTSSSQIQADYLNLLVTQLKNQDPMSPMDNNQMSSQLAQMSELQQMENLNSSFAKILQSAQTSQAAALIGKQVSFIPTGTSQELSGKVDAVTLEDGQVNLLIGSYTVAPTTILSITDSTTVNTTTK